MAAKKKVGLSITAGVLQDSAHGSHPASQRRFVEILVATCVAVLVWVVGVPAGRSAPLAPNTRLLAKADCAWAGETDQRDVNIGAPDLDAFYWMDVLTPSRSERVTITGSYPHARYFSFHVYNSSGTAITSIHDQQITASKGSSNPFRHAVPRHAGDRYTVLSSYSARPRHPRPDTLYVDPSTAGHVALLVYRLYVPQHPSDPRGGVGFPQVSTQNASGTSTLLRQAGCTTTPPAFGSPVWKELAMADYPSLAPRPRVAGATRIPTWQRSFGSKLGNQQNAYLGAIISRQYGQLLVIHARVPSFPNTRRGQPVHGRHQVRYWS